MTSTLTDAEIHIWQDVEGVNPADNLARLLSDLGVTGPIGYESDTVGLTDKTGRALHLAIPGLIDSSDLIRALRRVKSPAEVKMHRRAAALSDDALDQAIALARPGAFEGDILAAMQGAVFKGGGDYAGNEFILGSGPRCAVVSLLFGTQASGRDRSADAGMVGRLCSLSCCNDADGFGRAGQ